MCRRQNIIFPFTRGIGWPRNRLLEFYLLLFAALATACASSDPVFRTQPQAATAKPAITVLRSDSFRFDWDREIIPVKVDIERCAHEAIEGHFPELRYVSKAAFRQMAFPNLPDDAAPFELHNMRILLDSPVFYCYMQYLNKNLQSRIFLHSENI